MPARRPGPAPGPARGPRRRSRVRRRRPSQGAAPGASGDEAAQATARAEPKRPALGVGPALATTTGPLEAAPRRSREKVAIIGAGPAGLSAAYYLARRGYKPTIFEDLPVPGGMVHVGIPEYRLPRHVIPARPSSSSNEGVEIRYNTRVGRDSPSPTWRRSSRPPSSPSAPTLGRPLGIPGEDLPGSMDAIEFLRKVALGEKVDIGDDVLVLGGGNSAMDAARTAVALGAKNVQVVYRRTRERDAGQPLGDRRGRGRGRPLPLPGRSAWSARATTASTALVCQQMELGEPDESGRRKPVPADMAPVRAHGRQHHRRRGTEAGFCPLREAIGQAQQVGLHGSAIRYTLMTSKPGVFVGGDAVSGGGIGHRGHQRRQGGGQVHRQVPARRAGGGGPRGQDQAPRRVPGRPTSREPLAPTETTAGARPCPCCPRRCAGRASPTPSWAHLGAGLGGGAAMPALSPAGGGGVPRLSAAAGETPRRRRWRWRWCSMERPRACC